MSVIIIAGTVDVDPDKRDAALEAGLPHMEATRAWKGCLDYSWSADGLIPGRIQVFERWESQEDLAAHFEGPHYLNMRTTIAILTLGIMLTVGSVLADEAPQECLFHENFTTSPNPHPRWLRCGKSEAVHCARLHILPICRCFSSRETGSKR